MGDEDDRMEFIKSNARFLTHSTIIGPELVLGLFEKELIDPDEMDYLSNQATTNMTRAMTLYTKTSNKWIQSQFENFKLVLKDTGNTAALDVFTNSGAEFFLTNDQVQLLRQQKQRSEDGCYEGMEYEEEVGANKIVQYCRGNQFFQEGKFHLSSVIERGEVIRLIRQFSKSLKNETIWWNPQKPPLPLNYIPRSLGRYNPLGPYDSTSSEEYLSSDIEQSPTTLVEEAKKGFVSLVDAPGMGKSSEVTHVEQKLRENVASNRIILRVNLNEVQKALSDITEAETASGVLLKLAPFLPSSIFLIKDISVFALLDGLDEVCPKHKKTMINLLRILRSSNDSRNLNVVVTCRPHLKDTVESEFQLESWSVTPIRPAEQVAYMRAVGVSSEKITGIKTTLLTSQKGLLSNPLMLSMLANVLISGGCVSALDVNIYDLYSRFVEAKHELHCVEKLRMESKTNYTDIIRDSLLSKNLPFYYHVTLRQLNSKYYARLPGYTESIGSIAKEPTPTKSESNDTMELLSYGLVIEDQEKNLVFKHRSFAEFFYSRLLTEEKSTPQVVRDTLFGNIFAGYSELENVEALVKAALSNRPKGAELINITTKWILIERSLEDRSAWLKRFVTGKLFPLCTKEVLLTFASGDPRDLKEAIRVLLHPKSKKAFFTIVNYWMCENSENRLWSRKELFQINEHQLATSYTPQAAMFIVAIAVTLGSQELLTAAEVGVAIRSPHDNLIYIVASSDTEGNKWDFVDGHLKEGKLRELFLKADDEDFQRILDDKETMWKLVANLSEEEIFSLVTKKESRVTDIVGSNPAQVSAFLGVIFVSCLGEFRVKFGDHKGRTVFDLSEDGCQFALDVLWEDFLKEKEDNNSNGPVSVALREALGRPSTELLKNLVNVLRWRTKCARAHSTDHSLQINELNETHGLIPRLDTFKYSTVMDTLRALIISAGYEEKYSPFFYMLKDILQKNLEQMRIPRQWRVVVRSIGHATKEQVRTAAFTYSRPPQFVVSVGQVAIRLIPLYPTGKVEEKTWEEIVGDVILFTRCCEIPSVLNEWIQKCQIEDRHKNILKSKDVICRWGERFSSQWMKGYEDVDMCGLSHLLAFYFSVFGLNLQWMDVGKVQGRTDWQLVRELPLEIRTALESNPQWAPLLPVFMQQLMETIASNSQDIGVLLSCFHYRTEGDWEQLLRLIGWEDPLLWKLEVTKSTPSYKAAPLIRLFVRKLGVKAAKAKVARFWKCISPDICFSSESPESLGSLLHSAIELGELAEVKKRDWPGLLAWRNEQGNDALQVAKDTLGEGHPITLHLHSRTLSKRSSQFTLKVV